MNPRQQVVLNEISSRVTQSLRGLHSGSDTKHTQAWADYGYKDALEFADYYEMSERFGIAAAALTLPPELCWRTFPKVKEGSIEDGESRDSDTPWEDSVHDIFKKNKLWRKIKLADEYQRVGNYGAFVVQVRGNEQQAKWDQPLPNIRPDQIVKFTPLYEDQLKPTAWEGDQQSERYGQPTIYTFDESQVQVNGGNNEGRMRSVNVHWTRVIVFAEGADSDSIYGRPALKRCFNDLITLEKIIGAGGEGFWKSASMKTVYTNTNKDAPPPSSEEVDSMDEAIADFAAGMDKHLMTGGLDPKVLGVAMGDPEKPFNVALSSVAASIGVAAKLLIGSQEGRLASDQDGIFTLANMQSRRSGWCSQMMEAIVDWMMAHNIVARSEYEIEWDDLLAPSDKDKFELGERLTKVIVEMIKFTGESPIDPSEVAKIMGYKAQADDGEFEAEIDADEDDALSR
tara:strand:+ start:499 stop:1863 length:1365 start_codon:yes stop_codon:yes gene_type:complete